MDGKWMKTSAEDLLSLSWQRCCVFVCVCVCVKNSKSEREKTLIQSESYGGTMIDSPPAHPAAEDRSRKSFSFFFNIFNFKCVSFCFLLRKLIIRPWTFAPLGSSRPAQITNKFQNIKIYSSPSDALRVLIKIHEGLAYTKDEKTKCVGSQKRGCVKERKSPLKLLH